MKKFTVKEKHYLLNKITSLLVDNDWSKLLLLDNDLIVSVNSLHDNHEVLIGARIVQVFEDVADLSQYIKLVNEGEVL